MKKNRSIKHYVQFLLLTLALGLTIIFSIITLTTAYWVEDHIVYKVLEEQAKNLQNLSASNTLEKLQLPPNVTFYTAISSSPDWVSSNFSPKKDHGEIFVPGEDHYHYKKITLNGSEGILLMEVSHLLVVTGQTSILALCILGFVAAIILATFTAIYLSRKIVTPILTLTEAVKYAGENQYNKPMPALPYEIGYLSKAFEHSFNTVNKTLAKEQDFATNVSHELRTPLSIIRNACSLISQRGYQAKDLTTINRASMNMHNTINALMNLAREDKANTKTCYLKMQLETLILSEQLDIPQHWSITLNMPDGYSLDADTQLLDILLLNLLKNAIDYAATPTLKVQLDDDTLIFENDHSRFRQGKQAPSSPNTYNSGLGQGLYLSARIAEYLNWQLHHESSQSGFKVSLAFHSNSAS